MELLAFLSHDVFIIVRVGLGLALIKHNLTGRKFNFIVCFQSELHNPKTCCDIHISCYGGQKGSKVRGKDTYE